MVTFGNPIGFLALLAVPAILAIHFLQRESRHIATSTLFLLEEMAPESARGRRFERLRNSAQMWLQILAALLLTWLLAQPRWIRRDATQSVVIVLDSSISMSPFLAEMQRALDEDTGRLAQAAAKTEWQLLETDTTRPTLYSGPNRNALLAAARAWKPHLGAHDASPALLVTRTLVRGTGTLVFVSDSVRELPEGTRLLAVGRPLENCGFAGAVVEGKNWKALVKNYGRSAQRRDWWIEAGGQKSATHEIALEAGQTATLAGEFSNGEKACELVLSPDAFALDDKLPMVLPQPKTLAIAAQAGSPFADFFSQFTASIEAATSGGTQPDVRLFVYDPQAARLPDSTAIVFVADPSPTNQFLPGNVVAENDPLSSDLNWSGLLCRESAQVAAKPGDQVLVWQGGRPLIFLREENGASLLVVNFDLRASNATRLPAFVLMLHRFVENVRAEKVSVESKNVETNQALTVASNPALPPPAINEDRGKNLRAPAEPGFFTVKQGDDILLNSAAQFADPREADFRETTSVDQTRGAAAQITERNAQSDFLAPVCTLALGAAMIGSWTRRRS